MNDDRDLLVQLSKEPSGPVDRWTSGPMDQWTNEPIDQWTSGPVDQFNLVSSLTTGRLNVSTLFAWIPLLSVFPRTSWQPGPETEHLNSKLKKFQSFYCTGTVLRNFNMCFCHIYPSTKIQYQIGKMNWICNIFFCFKTLWLETYNFIVFAKHIKATLSNSTLSRNSTLTLWYLTLHNSSLLFATFLGRNTDM